MKKNIVCPICYENDFKVYVDVRDKVMQIKCINKKCKKTVSFSMKLQV